MSESPEFLYSFYSFNWGGPDLVDLTPNQVVEAYKNSPKIQITTGTRKGRTSPVAEIERFFKYPNIL